MRFSAWYGVFLGVLVIAQWAVFLGTGSVPELTEAPREIAFHIAAELAMALVLLVGSVVLLRRQPWGKPVYLVGLGMAVYSMINSPGYFAERGEWPLVAMFVVLLVTSVTAGILVSSRSTR